MSESLPEAPVGQNPCHSSRDPKTCPPTPQPCFPESKTLHHLLGPKSLPPPQKILAMQFSTRPRPNLGVLTRSGPERGFPEVARILPRAGGEKFWIPGELFLTPGAAKKDFFRGIMGAVERIFCCGGKDFGPPLSPPCDAHVTPNSASVCMHPHMHVRIRVAPPGRSYKHPLSVSVVQRKMARILCRPHELRGPTT